MYYFRDYDDALGDAQITGSDYLVLLKVCFSYSAYGSMAFTSKEQMERFSKLLFIENIETISNAKDRRKYRGYFSCLAKTEQFLGSYVNDLFHWIDFNEYGNPEDLSFYREDGSLFFWSETHEGICAVFNRETEDVTQIVSVKGWHHHEPQDGIVWGIPAYFSKTGDDFRKTGDG